MSCQRLLTVTGVTDVLTLQPNVPCSVWGVKEPRVHRLGSSPKTCAPEACSDGEPTEHPSRSVLDENFSSKNAYSVSAPVCPPWTTTPGCATAVNGDTPRSPSVPRYLLCRATPTL
eukprot:5396769-Amphidinium_carterae.1